MSDTSTKRARLAVMLSGSGRTLLNLIAAIREGRLSASIELVIVSRECVGAERARQAGLETLVMPGVIAAPELERVLDQHRIQWIACAGYLKYLNIPAKYAGRFVNIHPSLLPAFGGSGMFGDRVHQAVLAAGARESGCTVHLVDDVYDHGQVLLQVSCPVQPGEDAKMLAARVFELECRAYPEALQRLITGGE